MAALERMRSALKRIIKVPKSAIVHGHGEAQNAEEKQTG